MRRLLTVAVLGTALTVLIIVSRAVSDWHYVLSGPPGSLLYVSTFDPNTTDWQTYEGRLEAALADGGVEVQNGQAETYAYSLASPYLADFDLRAQAQAVSGPLNNGYGVVFRYRNPQNFMMFLISSDGYYSVTEVADGDQRVISTWIDTPLVATGIAAVNHLRVVSEGDRLRFYINNQRVSLCIPTDPGGISTYLEGTCYGGTLEEDVTLNASAAGQIGVVALTLDEPDVAARFDNVVIYSPEAAQ